MLFDKIVYYILCELVEIIDLDDLVVKYFFMMEIFLNVINCGLNFI